MDQLLDLGTAIPDIMGPTTKIYGALLAKNADAIKKTKKESHKCGPHPRHELDVYYPSDPTTHDEAPVLVFFHGGGLVRGDRIIESKPTPGLVYTNIGHYFAEEHGYITIVATYRLVHADDAKFPSGGEDVGYVVKWIKDNLSVPGQPRDLFLMGHSAGGLHLATYLLAPHFSDDLGTVTGNLKRQPIKLRGAILLSAPFSAGKPLPAREAMVEAYWGDRRNEDTPLGLLKSFQERHEGEYPLNNVDVLVIDAELDPEDEIRAGTTEFLAQWLKAGKQDMKDHILYREIQGHNHLSLVWSVGTGIEKEEAWAEEVSGFIESIRRRDQVQKDLQILQDSIKRPPPAKPAAEEKKAEEATE